MNENLLVVAVAPVFLRKANSPVRPAAGSVRIIDMPKK